MVDCPAGAVSELSDAMQQGQAVESGESYVWEELTVLKVGPPCYGGLPQVAYPWLEPGDPQHFLLHLDHPWVTPVVLLSLCIVCMCFEICKFLEGLIPRNTGFVLHYKTDLIKAGFACKSIHFIVAVVAWDL